MKVLSADGLTKLIQLIKSNFFSTSDGQAVSSVDIENVTSLGIDSTPTSGSSNLVTSGGVYSVISNPASTFIVSDCNDLTSSSGLTKAYQFTPGQTWAQWVSSSYNTDGWYIDSDTMVAISDFQSQGARRVHCVLGKNDDTGSTHKIVPSVYELYTGGPS